MEYVLEVSNLSKSFDSKKVVHDVSFKIEAGDIFGFLGPNGAGKTTTIRMMLGLIFPDKGSVKINGFDVFGDFKQAIGKVGAIVETPQFYPYLTGYQNLSLIANLHPQLTKARVHEVLDMVGLSQRAKDKVQTYSLGMKQRLGIARALLNYPTLIFLDEPTNGLDPQGMKEIREMISQLASEQNITFFISTHLLHEVEQICNKVAILNRGKLISQGSVKELLGKDSETVEVRTKDIERALNIINKIGYVKSVQHSQGGLQVELDKGYSGFLNQLLVAQNIMVEYIVPHKQTLEHFFIELTEGGNMVA